MRSPTSEYDEAVDSGMELLHLLDRSSLRFRVLHKAVHLDHELSRRQDGLLRFNVERPDLQKKSASSVGDKY